MSLTLFSPAKINLFLRVMGKRTDGYHELASLFQAIALGDTLTFKIAQEDRLTCSDPHLPCDDSNLIIKALHLFRKKTGLTRISPLSLSNSHTLSPDLHRQDSEAVLTQARPRYPDDESQVTERRFASKKCEKYGLTFGINIHLEKKIPIQAGLGGGSSNAATTLWALNTLHNKPYSEKELQFLSAELGSDVPFFFSCGTAYCTGRGEKVENLPPVTLPMPLALFKPAEGISTPAVYQALNLKHCSDKDPKRLLESFYTKEPLFINDLEEPACCLIPALRHYRLALLKQGWSFVSLSGSGTTFFGFPKEREFPLFKQVHFINRLPQSWYIMSI